MPIQIQCNNKGCGQINAAYLDPTTNKVYCSVCNNEIENITVFTKNQMKFAKQFKEKTKKSFSVKCKYCKNEDRPLIENDNIVCSSCLKVQDQLSPIFASMLKVQLKKLAEDK